MTEIYTPRDGDRVRTSSGAEWIVYVNSIGSGLLPAPEADGSTGRRRSRAIRPSERIVLIESAEETPEELLSRVELGLAVDRVEAFVEAFTYKRAESEEAIVDIGRLVEGVLVDYVLTVADLRLLISAARR